ncbi:MAG: hypothetical protein RL434_1928 [Pseudomonadota bacterium]|jgi:acetyl-CoA C-acetyltransferase
MNTSLDPRLPILVGAGQCVQRELGDATTLLSPVDLAAAAGRKALADTAAADRLGPLIDVLAMVRLFEHSVGDRGMWANPFGSSNNVPRSVARRLGLAPAHAIYAEVGGQSPQRLVNTLAARLHAGEIRAALLTGAEAIATIRHATRKGITLDWAEEIDGTCEDRWPGKPFVTPYEQQHGIAWPIHVYALFEQVRRARKKRSLADYRVDMATLLAPFSKCAAANPWSQFPTERSVEYLATVSAENYRLCEPYTRWMVAQDGVNQSAAVILTTVGVAVEVGIPASRWVHLHGHADLDEVNVLRRARLDMSEAQNRAVQLALAASNLTIDDIGPLDCYSCFPIAVSSIAEPLGLPLDGSRALTLTGGLPFFGGPGNNYSMHAIASLVEILRAQPLAKGLVVANGGYLSKHSVGVYSATPPASWQPVEGASEQRAVESAGNVQVDEAAQGRAIIEAPAAIYRKEQPVEGFVIARLCDSGSRCLARVMPGDQAGLTALFEERAIGREIEISRHEGLHHFTLV